MAPPTDGLSQTAVVQKIIDENAVVVFSKTTCPYCRKVKDLFRQLNVNTHVVELDTLSEGPAIQDALLQLTGQRTVPNVFIKRKHVGGCDATYAKHADGSLAKLLESVSNPVNADVDMDDANAAYDYDLVVIGGGSGGLACSKRAAELGAKVAVLDFVKPTPIGTTWGLGGTCVNVGCIPKKLMHTTAILGESIKDAVQYGWAAEPDKIAHDWGKMVQGVQDHIGGLNWGYKVALREKKVDYINALGSFVDRHTIKCVDRKGKEKIITARRSVIAVGGRPKYPEIPGAKEFGITSDDIFSLPEAPGKTLVVGASYVALECAGFLAGLGYDVTVMVRSIFLRGFDQEMAEKIVEYMAKHGVKFIRDSIPAKLEKTGEKEITVEYTNTGTHENHSGKWQTVLFAIGRDAVLQDLNLDTVGVTVKNGKIPAENEQTNIPNIYAIGDVLLGRLELTPVAIQAGRLLADRLYGGGKTQMDYRNIPTTVFTPIEYGAIGYPEEEAIAKFGADRIETYHTFFNPLEHTVAHREENVCYCKLVVDKGDNERVIGFHYLGPNAGEVTQGFALGFRLGATKADFDGIVGIHPTCAETFTTMTVTRSSGADIKAAGC
eukprot:Colp12_sorted_trinity150504_noHs@35476